MGNMIKVKAFLVADDIKKNPQNDKLTIEGVFFVIFAKSLPAIHKSLSVILIFEGESKKYKYELYLKHKGQELKITEVSFTKKDKIHQVINHINNMPLVSEGEYMFEAKLNGRAVARNTVEVKIIK